MEYIYRLIDDLDHSIIGEYSSFDDAFSDLYDIAIDYQECLEHLWLDEVLAESAEPQLFDNWLYNKFKDDGGIEGFYFITKESKED